MKKQRLREVKERCVSLRNGMEQSKAWQKELKYALQVAERQEETLMRKLRAGIIIVNSWVLVSIFCCSCRGVAGLGQDITWCGQAGEQMLQYESRNK